MQTAPDPLTVLTRFSQGHITAIDARRTLGDATYGDLLRLLAQARLRFPQSAPTGREDRLATARAWMFPRHVA